MGPPRWRLRSKRDTAKPKPCSGGTAPDVLLPPNLHRLNRDRFDRTIARLAGGDPADLLHDIHALDHLAKHAVLVIQPRGWRQRDEELTAVGIRPGVGHGQNPGLAVARFGMKLVGELETGSPGAGPERIAPLDHEVGDDAV